MMAPNYSLTSTFFDINVLTKCFDSLVSVLRVSVLPLSKIRVDAVSYVAVKYPWFLNHANCSAI